MFGSWYFFFTDSQLLPLALSKMALGSLKPFWQIYFTNSSNKALLRLLGAIFMGFTSSCSSSLLIGLTAPALATYNFSKRLRLLLKRPGSSSPTLLLVLIYVCLVALNYQTDDRQNMLNTAWFAGNGECGYRLKPEFLRKILNH